MEIMNAAREQKADDYVKEVNILHDMEEKFFKSRMRSKNSLKLSYKIRLTDLVQLLRDNKKHSEADELELEHKQFEQQKNKLHEIKIKKV